MGQIKEPHASPARLGALLSLIVLLTTTGCATSMTYSTFPRPLEPGDVAGSLAGQLTLNSTVIDKAINTLRIAEYHSTNAEELTEAEYRELFDTLVAFALFRPAITPEVAMRVGVWDGIDVGIRYNMSVFKGDAKVRLWESEDTKSVVSVTAGVGYAGSLGPKGLEYITWQKFSRLDAEISLMYGHEPSDYIRVYAGPRVIQTWLTVEPLISEELEEALPEEFEDYRPDQFYRNENILYVGGTVGAMLGYQWIWLHLEATIMYTHFNPVIVDKKRNLSGITLAPAVGLSVEF